MREIKFRAWDTVTNKYFWPWPEGFNLFGEVTCFECMGQQLSDTGRSSILGLNDLIIEQFTGLRDKNGREIYEGDILSIQGIVPIVVSFDRGMFIQSTIGPYCSLLEYVNNYAAFGEPEILGNIHENPELLNG